MRSSESVRAAVARSPYLVSVTGDSSTFTGDLGSLSSLTGERGVGLYARMLLLTLHTLLVRLLSQSWKPDSCEVREEFMMFFTELSGSQQFSDAGLTEPLLWKDPDLDLLNIFIKTHKLKCPTVNLEMLLWNLYF